MASNSRIANGLVALSAAAVFAVYSAGYARTRSAAQRLAGEAAERRPPVPAAITALVPPALPQPVKVETRSPGTPERHTRTPEPKNPRTREPQNPRTDPRLSAPAVASETPSPAPAAPAATSPAAQTPPVTEADRKAADPEPAPAVASASQYKDGTYLGWGTSRHGDIQASVVIESGRIVSAAIAQCLTRYSCQWIAHLPPQVVVRQSADVDYVSGATQSTNAFYYAVLDALTKAK